MRKLFTVLIVHAKYSKFFMKYVNLIILPLILCLLSPLQAEILDKVVATIGSEPVTLLEVREILRKKSVGKPNATGRLSETDIREAILVLLFNREASRLGVSIADEEIDDYVRKVESANGGESGSLEKSVLAQGYTMDQYRDKIKTELERSRVLAINVRALVQVSDEEVSKYLGEEQKADNKEGFYLLQMSYKNLEQDTLDKVLSYVKENKKCFSSSEFDAQCVFMGEVKVEDLKEDLREKVEDLDLYESVKGVSLEGSESGELRMYLRVEGNFGEDRGDTFLKVKEQIYQKKFMEKANEFISTNIFEKYAVEIY